MIEYHFAIAPDRSAIHKILDDLEHLYHQHKIAYQISEKVFFHLCLTIDEILTNIISYGLSSQPSPCITLNITIEQKKLDILIKDNGSVFNPLTFIPPEHKKNLENTPIGKVGIQFVKTFSRNIQYHRINEFNCLSFECSETV